MNKYRFSEHGVGYKVGRALQPFRPQFALIGSRISAHAKVLDVGCGDGVLGEILIKENKCRVWGVDLDEIGVREAKIRGVAAQVLSVDEGLPFKSKSFDVVVASDILQYLKNPDFAVSEMLRVGKSVIIYFPNFGFWFYRLTFLLLGRFPRFSLYGHTWFETQQTKFFSFADFMSLPSLKKVKVVGVESIDWRNRKLSSLAKFAPNFFGRGSLVEIRKS